MNFICIICVKPNKIWLDFLNTFTTYKVVVIIDDNSADYRITPQCVQIPDGACAAAGFTNTSFTLGKTVSGWDKALYYFAHHPCANVWFLEEDVFVYDEATLRSIDAKYPKSDLLTNVFTINATGQQTDWHWPVISIKIPPPYYAAMCCATRMSSHLLRSIKAYAHTYKTLFFLEALFPTLCKSCGLVYDTPAELHAIHYRRDFAATDIVIANLYHPVKNLEQHIEFRRSWVRHAVRRKARV